MARQLLNRAEIRLPEVPLTDWALGAVSINPLTERYRFAQPDAPSDVRGRPITGDYEHRVHQLRILRQAMVDFAGVHGPANKLRPILSQE
jgi:hypothetical protein